MAGDPIEATRTGVKLLVSELRSDPMAMETTYLSVITFSSTAQQVCPLTELAMFQEPTIDAGGSTALGDALEELLKCADRELTKQTGDKKGDYKPLVFLMTDGQPTDSWEAAANKVKNKHWNVIACAAGSGADEALLKRITEAVVKLNDCQPGTLKAFFMWVSASIKTTSQSVQQVAADAPVNLPPPPPGIQIVP
jgi:uncharacterized protein YegL